MAELGLDLLDERWRAERAADPLGSPQPVRVVLEQVLRQKWRPVGDEFEQRLEGRQPVRLPA